MFQSRVSSNQIGLTAMKMFVIDKPTILTVRTQDFILTLFYPITPGLIMFLFESIYY